MVEQLNSKLESIAQNNSYGLILFKPDAVENDLVEILIAHVLSSNPFYGNTEIKDICILPPINDIEVLRKIYPNLNEKILKNNLRLFSSNSSVALLLKGEDINMWEELDKIKGKVIKNSPHGLQDGLRGIVPVIGEQEAFIKAQHRILNNEELTITDKDSLARNLVHTPDSYSERLYILQLMDTCKESYNNNNNDEI
jgi:hypothetical protein